MSDHGELKRLALTCGNLNWRFLTEKLTEYGIRDDHGYIAFLPVGHPAKYGACPEREAKARFLGAMTPAAVLGLLAEIEVLRDDIEQTQYDANAWRNGEESVWIEVFNSEGDDPFISAITGQITIEQLALIQAEILEYREDYFEKGSGLYVFKCRHCQAHHDNVGMTEPAHWETDFESYSPFPWEEEAAAMSKGEQS